jgi:uncharacterized protein
MRIVIDTNDFISALIGKIHRQKLSKVLNIPEIEIYADQNLITEIREVALREKFRKYISVDDIDIFIEVLSIRLTFIESTSQVFESPDPDDNYLLALAKDSKAEYLITGDKKDLLDLSPFNGIKIIRLQQFLDILRN